MSLRGWLVVTALVLVAAAGAACGAGGEEVVDAVGSGPSRSASGHDGARPPPARVEGPSGSSRMALGSYCWQGGVPGQGSEAAPGICVDKVAPEQRRDLPRLSVAAGQAVSFHLGFEPSALHVSLGDEQETLPARSTVSWTPAGSGVLTLFAEAGGRAGDVAYHVRLVRDGG